MLIVNSMPLILSNWNTYYVGKYAMVPREMVLYVAFILEELP